MSRESFAEFIDIAPAPAEQVAPLARTMLAHGEPSGGRSSLNNDGTPLQICVSVGGARRTCRLIADPAATVGDADARFARGEAALGALLDARGPALRGLCEHILAATLPPPGERAALPSGLLWLAADLAGPGLAVYTTARWGDEAGRWTRALAWLDEVLPDSRAARGRLEPLRTLARPVAHAIEGADPARARAKLYFRTVAPEPMVRLGLDLLHDAWVVEFLELLIGDAAIRAETIVYSLGFTIGDGALCDIKLDVCAHCTPRSPPAWTALLGEWTERSGAAAFGVDRALLSGAAEVAFVGAGVRSDGELRTNLYLKPPSP